MLSSAQVHEAIWDFKQRRQREEGGSVQCPRCPAMVKPNRRTQRFLGKWRIQLHVLVDCVRGLSVYGCFWSCSGQSIWKLTGDTSWRVFLRIMPSLADPSNICRSLSRPPRIHHFLYWSPLSPCFLSSSSYWHNCSLVCSSLHWIA